MGCAMYKVEVHIRPQRIPVDGRIRGWYLEIETMVGGKNDRPRVTLFHRTTKKAVVNLAKALQTAVIQEMKF